MIALTENQISILPTDAGEQCTGSLEYVVQTLEEEIVLGVLNPRERLIEDEILGRFGVKRHVARQVLVELERMGLVERKRNIGAVVRSYTAKEVEDLYVVRELLECQCARMIHFPVAESKLKSLVDTQNVHDAMVKAGNLRGVFRANMKFHSLLFGLTDNLVLSSAIRYYALRAHGIRSSSLLRPELIEQARKEHWEMIQAIRDGATDRLVELCRNHLYPSRDTYVNSYIRRSDVVYPDRNSVK